MRKYKRIEASIIDLKKLKERDERIKYKLKLYGLNIITGCEIEDLKTKKNDMTDLEKSLGNMLYDLNETSKHCVELLDWYENERHAMRRELERLRELNKELLNK